VTRLRAEQTLARQILIQHGLHESTELVVRWDVSDGGWGFRQYVLREFGGRKKAHMYITKRLQEYM